MPVVGEHPPGTREVSVLDGTCGENVGGSSCHSLLISLSSGDLWPPCTQASHLYLSESLCKKTSTPHWILETRNLFEFGVTRFKWNKLFVCLWAHLHKAPTYCGGLHARMIPQVILSGQFALGRVSLGKLVLGDRAIQKDPYDRREIRGRGYSAREMVTKAPPWSQAWVRVVCQSVVCDEA